MYCAIGQSEAKWAGQLPEAVQEAVPEAGIKQFQKPNLSDAAGLNILLKPNA